MTFAVTPTFYLNIYAQRFVMKHLDCMSRAELFGNLLRLDFDDLSVGTAHRWRHSFFTRNGYSQLSQIDPIRQK